MVIFKTFKFGVGISALQRRRYLLLAVILCIFFTACPAYCSTYTYFVAPDGNDSNIGDINHPFQTIDKGVSAAAAGDTIYLRGGMHYNAKTIPISKSGQDGNLITLQNYQNESVIVDFNSQQRVSNYRGIQLTGSYWHFKGFTVRNSADNGIYVNGSYNIFEQLITHHNGDSGIHIYANASYAPAYNQVINCDSYLNYDPYATGENADGFAAKGPTPNPTQYNLGPGNVFKGCRAWNNSDDGFDLWWAGNSVRIENCWAFRNGVDVWGMGLSFNGDGQGIKLGQGGGGHILISCMAYEQQHKGFDRNSNNTGGIVIYNCTSVKNLGENFYFNDPCTAHTYVLRNNLSYLGSVVISNQTDDEYNSWNGFTVTDADFASLDANFPPITDPNTYSNANSVGIDRPRGPDGELPKLRFLRLANTSALIDAGMDVNVPFYGDAPDLGAFEHIDGDCQPDGDVDSLDLKCLADNWLDSDCGTCNGANFDGIGGVDFYDFVLMAENWMK
jgi:hypothetical protein